MADQTQPEELFQRYLDNRCSREEVQQLMRYFHTDQRQLLDALIEKEMNRPEISTPNDNDEFFAAVYEQIERKIREPKRTYRLWPRIAAAASIVLTLSIGAYLVINHHPENQQATQVPKQNDVLPGGNKAYLTLGNGQRISLSDAQNGTIAKQGDKTIQKTTDGRIIYDNSHSNHTNSEILYNTVETPRGGQYQVVLPDGSKVWLNAASSIKYAADFTGKERLVELTGEAYFEVVHNDHQPFRVKTPAQTVEDLGTHFNINAYSDEPRTATTLLEGSVRIQNEQANVILKPGQQAITPTGQESIKINPADLESVVAWKNGVTHFEDADIQTVMRNLARWYDVTVSYEGEMPKRLFTGDIPRNLKASQALQILELLKIKFKIENKHITITKP